MPLKPWKTLESRPIYTNPWMRLAWLKRFAAPQDEYHM
jgi:hypothetical protein